MRALATLLVGAALAAGAPLPAHAQATWPARPVTIVVPFAAGGVTDILARFYAQKLATRTGGAFNVENRAGGNGTIGTDFVARAAPNGYTLGVFLDSNTIAPALFAKLGSDPIRGSTPISMMAVGQHIVVAHPSFGPSSLKELIEHAKASPGEPYATSGQGTAQHLGMELIKLKAGIALTHVPYKGGGQAIADVVGGQVKLAILGLAPVLPYLRSGRAQGDRADRRQAHAAAAGRAHGERDAAGRDHAAVVRPRRAGGNAGGRGAEVAPELLALAQDTEVESKLASIGLESRTSAQPSDLTRFMEQDLLKWPPLVKAAGLKPE